MNKKLPNIFVNRNTGVIKNNSEFYYGNDNSKEKIISDDMKSILIKKKINDIFSSNNFIYKANVIISSSNGDKSYTIIARDKEKLLTINNEVILISDILDIRLDN